jgi:hypothetical protein
MDKKITISLPEELFCKLEEEAVKNQLPFDELLLRKLNKVYSEFEERYLTNKVKNTRIDYLEKERDRLLKQLYEGRLYSTEQFQLGCIERELEKFIPKSEEEKRLDKVTELAFDEFFDKPRRTEEEILKDLEELKKNKKNNDLDNE